MSFFWGGWFDGSGNIYARGDEDEDEDEDGVRTLVLVSYLTENIRHMLLT